MICFKCGHLAEHHVYYGNVHSASNAGCNMCRRHRVAGSNFYRHEMPSNLEFLERKAEEKLSVN